MRRLILLLAAVVFTALAGPRESQATTISVDTGWDNVGVIADTSDVLSFDFTLLTAGVFSLSDCCIIGDTWTLSGGIAGASTVGLAAIAVPLGIGAFASFYDPVWVDAAYSHFQVALAAGTYSFSVSGDAGGGLPAEFGLRVDTLSPSAIPIPAGFGLLALGLGALGALRRRRGNAV